MPLKHPSPPTFALLAWKQGKINAWANLPERYAYSPELQGPPGPFLCSSSVNGTICLPSSPFPSHFLSPTAKIQLKVTTADFHCHVSQCCLAKHLLMSTPAGKVQRERGILHSKKPPTPSLPLLLGNQRWFIHLGLDALLPRPPGSHNREIEPRHLGFSSGG